MMDDPFGDPNIIEDIQASLLVDKPALPSESDNQSGVSWEDYCDTDYTNQIDKEFQEYETSPDFYETNHDEKDNSSNPGNRDNERVDSWAGAKFLLTPVTFIANFAATQITALKNAVSSRSDTEHSRQADETTKLDELGSPKKIMASLSRETPTRSETAFTTQDELFDKVGAPPNEEGICSPMVNLYFEEQLGYRDRSYREGDPTHIYEEAIKEKQHQIDLIHKGKDGVHAVFVDHHIPYDKKIVKASESESEEKVETLLKDYDQMLVTYPVVREDGEMDRHQIYVEKVDDSRCARFDVNKQGGVDEMPCKMFYQKLAKKIAKTHEGNTDDEEEVVVAGIMKRK
ncbi:hypothetical protein FOLKNPGA_02122 [Legionella sp. PC1000]|uniref:hypothetical protein n=1 Tax=Legionella sp. PC1000 TaxID=2746060 RepID=UPI0015FC91F6|nr:hypothetical protein [Legionella sp. PC1000]QLZ69339.1 hypothetical protein FOLKNPGA_02122 [Legionella sp. PC1000]